MHPKEFAEHWGLTPGELATLLNRHQNTIYHWLNESKEPSAEIQREIRAIHLRWLEWQLQDEMLPRHIRELYEIARDRLEFKKLADERRARGGS